jgi:group I intron endonuclease
MIVKAPINSYYLYLYENIINGKVYVGQTTNIKTRHRAHCSTNFNGMPIDNAIKKYGHYAFILTIILVTDTLERVNQEEIYWIARIREYLGYNNVYNISDGASTPMTQETKTKISQSKMGEKNAFFGKTHTDETKRKLSANLAGNSFRLGKTASVITKLNISKAVTGEKNPNSKLTLSQVIEIRHLYSNNVFSQIELSKKFNVALITISRLLRNKTWNK